MKRILVIEDEPGISGFLKEGLEEEGFQIDVAEDGTTGLQKFKNHSFDLILMDWMLPGMSGVEVTEQIRKVNADVPIIFLTAKDTVQDTILGLRSGANDYLKKPFSFSELLERIKVHFRNGSKDKKVITYGPLNLDPVQRTVTKEESVITLTQKEFDLLHFLMKNMNSVCTRKEILDKVWDIHFEYSSGVIDVYINALRKKFQLPKEYSFIETVWGIGYMIKEHETEQA
ncbi:MAG: response regulator transcription factor [Bacteroidales bacterium]|nr:response regulator transcription factor [Bacteroidales bacterium]